MNNIKISPSILSADFAQMGKGVEAADKWGADFIHCDVMDGVFVPNITFGMPMVKALKNHSNKPFDVHLMISQPEKYVAQFADAGADIITFHPDASNDIDFALDTIKQKGKLCGLVLNPDKPLSLIQPYINKIDIILIMSVYAGFGGQGFIKDVIPKIKEAKKLIELSGRDIMLEVDGGITEDNAQSVVDAGANVLVAGSSVYKSADPAKTIKILRGEK